MTSINVYFVKFKETKKHFNYQYLNQWRSVSLIAFKQKYITIKTQKTGIFNDQTLPLHVCNLIAIKRRQSKIHTTHTHTHTLT